MPTISPRWDLQPCDDAAAATLAAALDLEPAVARLLCQRGLGEPDAASRFLNPSLDHLHDPMALMDMRVAIDRLLLDIIDNERKAHGAISIWDRSPSSLRIDDGRARDADPNVNIIIREPGHVEYAASLGLGVADLSKIKVQELTV